MGSVSPEKTVRNVLVIGAGPAGLAAARYLKEEQFFEKIVVVERRPGPGGLWNYENTRKASTSQAGFDTPMYRELEVNIPSDLMHFSHLDLPSGHPLFPPRQVILDYLNDYAKSLELDIEYSTEVELVKDVQGQWEVTTKNLISGQISEDSYQAVVVASGCHDLPNYPDIPGLQEWMEQYPNTVSHSADYNGPEPFEGLRTLVVGNSVSGLDISRRLAGVQKPPANPIFVSQRSKSTYYTPAPSNIAEVPATVSFDPSTKSAQFSDGIVVRDIERIVLCTGFLFSFPFLGENSPALQPRESQPQGSSTSTRTYGLYEYIFPYDSSANGRLDCPPIAFIGLLEKLVPFQCMEMQCSVAAGIFSGRLSLPSNEEMQQWEKAEIDAKGLKGWNSLRYPRDVEYYDRLFQWTSGGKPRMFPKNWDDKSKWLRTQIPKLRHAFMDKGESRTEIQTIGQLGFQYPPSN